MDQHPIRSWGELEILCTWYRNQDNLQLYGRIYGYDVKSNKKKIQSKLLLEWTIVPLEIKKTSMHSLIISHR